MNKSLFSHSAGVFLMLLLSFPGAQGQEAETLDTVEKRYSYSIGVFLGEQLLNQVGQEIGIDLPIMVKGMSALILKQELLLEEDEMNQAIQAIQMRELERAAEQSKLNAEASLAYLEDNKKKEGVIVTDSGLQYSIINSGDSAGITAELDDTVIVHYQGTLINGTVFDSSYGRGEPASFPLQSIIPGWIEVLQLMRPGDKWSIALPPELAYGEKGTGQSIGSNEVLLFDIELLEVKKSGNTE